MTTEPPQVMEREIKECNLKLFYRKDLHVLIARWESCEGVERVRKGYMEVLEMARELECHYWIMDLRGRGPRSTKENYWVLHVFFEAIKDTLEGCVYMAYLLTPSYYNIVVP